MTLKKLLLPPLLPVALLLLLAAWAFYSEKAGEVRTIGGRPDNAPIRASAIIAILSPLVYIMFGIFNLIDATLDRFSLRTSWIGTLVLASALGLFLAHRFYAREVDSTPFFAIGLGFGMSLLIFGPMAAIRRFAIRNRGTRNRK